MTWAREMTNEVKSVFSERKNLREGILWIISKLTGIMSSGNNHNNNKKESQSYVKTATVHEGQTKTLTVMLLLSQEVVFMGTWPEADLWTCADNGIMPSWGERRTDWKRPLWSITPVSTRSVSLGCLDGTMRGKRSKNCVMVTAGELLPQTQEATLPPPGQDLLSWSLGAGKGQKEKLWSFSGLLIGFMMKPRSPSRIQ